MSGNDAGHAALSPPAGKPFSEASSSNDPQRPTRGTGTCASCTSPSKSRGGTLNCQCRSSAPDSLSVRSLLGVGKPGAGRPGLGTAGSIPRAASPRAALAAVACEASLARLSLWCRGTAAGPAAFPSHTPKLASGSERRSKSFVGGVGGAGSFSSAAGAGPSTVQVATMISVEAVAVSCDASCSQACCSACWTAMRWEDEMHSKRSIKSIAAADTPPKRSSGKATVLPAAGAPERSRF